MMKYIICSLLLLTVTTLAIAPIKRMDPACPTTPATSCLSIPTSYEANPPNDFCLLPNIQSIYKGIWAPKLKCKFVGSLFNINNCTDHSTDEGFGTIDCLDEDYTRVVLDSTLKPYPGAYWRIDYGLSIGHITMYNNRQVCVVLHEIGMNECWQQKNPDLQLSSGGINGVETDSPDVSFIPLIQAMDSTSENFSPLWIVTAWENFPVITRTHHAPSDCPPVHTFTSYVLITLRQPVGPYNVKYIVTERPAAIGLVYNGYGYANTINTTGYVSQHAYNYSASGVSDFRSRDTDVYVGDQSGYEWMLGNVLSITSRCVECTLTPAVDPQEAEFNQPGVILSEGWGHAVCRSTCPGGNERSSGVGTNEMSYF